jgi:hypothetical protein
MADILFSDMSNSLAYNSPIGTDNYVSAANSGGGLWNSLSSMFSPILSTAATVGSVYVNGKINAEATKAAQDAANRQAAATSAQSSSNLSRILLFGGVALVGIVAIVFVMRKL